MAVTFKSKATGDVLMLSAHAEQVLEVIGKTAAAAGILQPASMPAALEKLRALPDLDADDTDRAQTQNELGVDADVPPDVPMSDGISLRKRAWPLVKMIEAALAADQAIVWGV